MIICSPSGEKIARAGAPRAQRHRADHLAGVPRCRAAIQNGADLLQDAELLARHGRWARAFALAALAFEEIRKTLLYVLSLLDPAITLAELNKDLRNHPTKLTGAFSLLHVLSVGQPEPMAEAITRAAGLAPEVHQAKMRGFYVDVAPDGSCRTPAEITEEQATCLIRDFGVVVDVLRSWLTDEALEKMTELAGTYAEEFSQLAALGKQLATDVPDTAAEYARKMLLEGWVPETEADPT